MFPRSNEKKTLIEIKKLYYLKKYLFCSIQLFIMNVHISPSTT